MVNLWKHGLGLLLGRIWEIVPRGTKKMLPVRLFHVEHLFCESGGSSLGLSRICP